MKDLFILLGSWNSANLGKHKYLHHLVFEGSWSYNNYGEYLHSLPHHNNHGCHIHAARSLYDRKSSPENSNVDWWAVHRGPLFICSYTQNYYLFIFLYAVVLGLGFGLLYMVSLKKCMAVLPKQERNDIWSDYVMLQCRRDHMGHCDETSCEPQKLKTKWR
jgi:hypothetical protein